MKRIIFIPCFLFLFSISNPLLAQFHVMLEVPELRTPEKLLDKNIKEIIIVEQGDEKFETINSSQDVAKIIQMLRANEKNLTSEGQLLSKSLEFHEKFDLEYEFLPAILNEPEIITQVQKYNEEFKVTNEIVQYYISEHAINESAYVDFQNMFYEYPFEENVSRYEYGGIKLHIPNPLILSDNTRIDLEFKRTTCDNRRANQPVADILIETLRDCLKQANDNLTRLGFERINNITITSTTNGHCSPKQRKSNHHSGTAIDISAINGISINYTAKKNTRRYIFELQNAFNLHKYIRECYGPSFNDKTDFKTKITTSMVDSYSRIIRPHYNHLHISVRNE
ncbi:hypothetical protein ABV409_12815 [Flagellimonas sp. DF-77]|uniref:hypothetical protein n=1 Tax=Flagellimonas algarum TaxID=3230298 RepID=UPI00339665A9